LLAGALSAQDAGSPASVPAPPAPASGVLIVSSLHGEPAEAEIGLYVADAIGRVTELRCPDLADQLRPAINDADPAARKTDAQLAALGEKADCRFVVLVTAAAGEDGPASVTCRLIDRQAADGGAETIELPAAAGSPIVLGEAAARAVLARLPVSQAARDAFAGRRQATANAAAWADYCQGLRAWAVGDRAGALAAAVKATKADRDFAAGYCLMGRVLADGKRPVLAEAAFRKAGELDGGRGDAHHGLAEVLRQRDQLADALAVAELAVLAEPAQPRHRQLVGAIQQARGRHEDALAAYDATAALGLCDPAVHVSRGQCLAKLNRTAEAIAVLNRAIEAAPKSIVARNSLADVQWQAGDPDAALETLDLSVQIDPGQNGAYFQTAEIYLQLQRWDRAIDVLKKITDESDRRGAAFVAQAWKMIGEAHAGAGRTQEALAACTRSLALRPDPTVQAMIDRLNAPPQRP
jgi:tetratricopeptide (TPR) repeat protein